mmetsp:Transcript_2951/g.11728  ORF Transcript_2951/g.11728 Transcript_2951/m.11728 type:complete len:319 (+) Transcript_2951:1220-2176(+)
MHASTCLSRVEVRKTPSWRHSGHLSRSRQDTGSSAASPAATRDTVCRPRRDTASDVPRWSRTPAARSRQSRQNTCPHSKPTGLYSVSRHTPHVGWSCDKVRASTAPLGEASNAETSKPSISLADPNEDDGYVPKERGASFSFSSFSFRRLVSHTGPSSPSVSIPATALSSMVTGECNIWYSDFFQYAASALRPRDDKLVLSHFFKILRSAVALSSAQRRHSRASVVASMCSPRKSGASWDASTNRVPSRTEGANSRRDKGGAQGKPRNRAPFRIEPESDFLYTPLLGDLPPSGARVNILSVHPKYALDAAAISRSSSA